MGALASLFVGRPLNILVVAALFLAGHVVLQRASARPRRYPRALLVATLAWALYGAWEWLVRLRTPEADIRVDLLIIWPVLALVSVWMIVRAGLHRDGA